MPFIYFILLIIASLKWLLPYIMIGIISYIVVVLLVFLFNKKKREKIILYKNESPKNIAMRVDSSNLHSIEIISKQQEEKIQILIEKLSKSALTEKNELIYHLQSFCLEYKQKRNLYQLDLYGYISFAISGNIHIIENESVQRKYETILQIIHLLEDGIIMEDIIHSISIMEEINFEKVNVKNFNVETENNKIGDLHLETNIKERGKQPISIVDSLAISQIIAGLLNHAVQQEKVENDKKLLNLQVRAREQAHILHNSGRLEEEIEFIRKELEYCDLDSSYYKYWDLLLKKRITENEEQKESCMHSSLISQIVFGLLNHAIQQTKKKEDFCEVDFKYGLFSTTQSVPDKINVVSNDISECLIEKKMSPEIMNDNSIEKVPYWEHAYVYSAEYLQNANQYQKQFYNYFKEEFLKRHYLNIENNSNYAFVLMFDLADDYKKHKNYNLLESQLSALAENYPVTARYTSKTLLNSVIAVNQEDAESVLKSYDKSRGQLCSWITPEETVDVQGIKLTRGNFYIGECFLLPNNVVERNHLNYCGYTGEYIYASVLNPNLPVNMNEDLHRNIFCSYYDMSPAIRYEYLMWLSGEKKAQEISTDVLLFYLYGCEIRMFIDQRTKIRNAKKY